MAGTRIVVKEVHPSKKQKPSDCKKMAEEGEGAFSYDEFGKACWKVSGKQIKIEPNENSIMEGFIITNFNFNAGSGVKPQEKPEDLPGPKMLSE